MVLPRQTLPVVGGDGNGEVADEKEIERVTQEKKKNKKGPKEKEKKKNYMAGEG